MPQHRRTRPPSRRLPRLVLAAAAGLALSALAVRWQTRAAERAFPPRGRFVDVDGQRLHVAEYGAGDERTLVLLHGNGVTGEDFDIAGLVARALPRWRVLVIDRPGYGWSPPAPRHLEPEQQADLVARALRQLDIEQPVVLGHSWGALVALALGLRHPRRVRALVLASGYWRTSAALFPWLGALPALPLAGALWRHTVGPFVARLAWWPATRRLFSPAPVSADFINLTPLPLIVRPSQLKASAQDSAALVGAAQRLDRQLRELQVPVVVLTGEGDALVSPQWHSAWLQRHLPGSRMHVVKGAGHMLHHTAPDEVMNAIEEADALLSASAQRALDLRPGTTAPQAL